MTTEGVLYVACGATYIRVAVRSARSVRRHSPNLGIHLFADLQNHPQFDFDRDAFPFTSTARIQDPHRRSKVDYMVRTPFDRTLYLDTDTLVMADVQDMFRLLERFDFAASHAHRRNDPSRLGTWRIEIPRAFPQANAGVLLYGKTPPCHRVPGGVAAPVPRSRPVPGPSDAAGTALAKRPALRHPPTRVQRPLCQVSLPLVASGGQHQDLSPASLPQRLVLVACGPVATTSLAGSAAHWVEGSGCLVPPLTRSWRRRPRASSTLRRAPSTSAPRCARRAVPAGIVMTLQRIFSPTGRTTQSSILAATRRLSHRPATFRTHTDAPRWITFPERHSTGRSTWILTR